MSTILVQQVHKTLGHGPQATHALRGVSLEAKPGDFVAISGKSGSGKTTLLNSIAGLLPVDSGTITVGDSVVSQSDETELLSLRRETIGVVHQSDLIIAELTAAENIELVLAAAGWDPALTRQETERLLDHVGLAGLGHRYPTELSRGQCQRVGIARALSGQRSVLLADEPSAALDQENSHAVFALFRSLARAGSTVIVTSHDPLVLEYCSHSFELIDGSLRDANGMKRKASTRA
ncbi:ABC transporter ATP-binding protein [Corynebacterium sp.]|uniref:ABC transporter ATP-binding protein n=1 Tax=Corynebacterium sp. TaxID=1720 RepID=UPI0026DD6677|nr:ABC transporter ATP-binding protein [Corynebacterium sp.]MDO5031280.1 ABC transporter ATP-binding protein [Corynebacterium sp.]